MTSEAPKSRLKNSQWKSKPSVDLEEAWEASGPTAIETVRRLDPGAYIAAIARLVRGLD